MTLPFDGAISKFYKDTAPIAVRDAIKEAGKKDILAPNWPYEDRMDRDEYEDTLYKLQIELQKFQAWVKDSKSRVVIVFEGRDAAGKGGTIKRFRENLNPRVAHTVALSKPSDREAEEWYFQRYIRHLPTGGEITLFDRSWYNRGVVEKVFGFCEDAERELFFAQVPAFEQMLIDDGVHLSKLWLSVSRPEQLRRFLSREQDLLKHWKLSWIDVEGLNRWEAYSDAIKETFDRSSAPVPWTIVRSDDKRRARIAAIQAVLSQIDYAEKDASVACPPDPKIAGGPELWHA